MYNFDSYDVLLSISSNILVLLMTAFILQGHIWCILVNFGGIFALINGPSTFKTNPVCVCVCVCERDCTCFSILVGS